MRNNYPTYPGWRTVREIGRGSFGAVYEIERKIGGVTEKAALKHISIPKDDGEIRSMRQMGMDDASITNMFEEQKEHVLKEYLLMRALGGHTNVVNCDDVSEIQHSDGIGWDIYIRMELLEPMTAKLKSYPGEAETIRFALDFCSALVLCEKHKIIHRDIKPQNIFASPNGDYKLGDFGIARTIESATHGASTIGIGTNNYMAPEVRYGNENYNHTVDIYSLGLVMYWLMNEMRLPFCPLPPVPLKLSDVQNAQARRMRGETLPAPKHGSDRLKAIVLKACAFEPKERYQSAAEMKLALEALSKTEEKLVEVAPMIDTLMDDATMGAWSPVCQDPPVIEVVPVVEPIVVDEPVLIAENFATPTDEDKTVGMWATIEAERERKHKEAEAARCLADEAVEMERRRLLEEQRIREDKAAELKRQKELEEKKMHEAEEAERIRKLKVSKNTRYKILIQRCIEVVLFYIVCDIILGLGPFYEIWWDWTIGLSADGELFAALIITCIASTLPLFWIRKILKYIICKCFPEKIEGLTGTDEVAILFGIIVVGTILGICSSDIINDSMISEIVSILGIMLLIGGFGLLITDLISFFWQSCKRKILDRPNDRIF